MSQPSLLEDFLLYTKHIKSPDNFIIGSFYWMIGAALQRRVWLNSTKSGIFPNTYTGLCGGPGVGKGIIIKPVTDMLRYHKISSTTNSMETSIDKMLSKATKEGATPDTIKLLQQAKESMQQLAEVGNKKSNPRDEKYLFPIGADATTFQSMVQEHGGAVRVFYSTPCPIAPSGIYTYHSIIFILQEASSLFEENAKMKVDYLLHAYDCSDYKYKTKTQGEDIIKRSSLSLLFGTTPDFVRTAFSNSLFTEGFTSRCIFIYGKESRFEDWKIPELTPEQCAAEQRILERLKMISKLFGLCCLSPEAEAMMDSYFKGIDCQHKKDAQKNDDKLEPYFARKNLHVQKIAMCVHFADSDSMTIDVESLDKAFKFLSSIEETMAYCLNIRGFNPGGDLSRRIHKFIKERGGRQGMLYTEIVIKFSDDGTMQQIDEALNLLMVANKIKQDGGYYLSNT